jgi:hypothetical protein
MAFVFNQPHFLISSIQDKFVRELIRVTDRTKLLDNSELTNVRQMTYNFEPTATPLDHTTYGWAS